MSKVAKIFVVVNLVFALVYVGVNASLLAKQEHFKYLYLKEKSLHEKDNTDKDAEIKAQKDKVGQMTTSYNTERERADNLETQLQTQMQTNSNLETKWNQLNNNYNSLEQRYQTLSTELKDSREEIKSLQAELVTSKTNLDSALKRRDQAQDDLARIQKESGDLKLVLDDLKKRHVELAMKNQELRFTLNGIQEKIKLPVEDIIDKMPQISGQIVGVSTKHDLVVINRGEEDQVQVGFTFTIFRGSEYVAKMVVEKVYPNQAAGRVLPMTKKDKVLVGDKVATKIY